MPAPSGQIPPPWARWENQAPTTRAARRPIPGNGQPVASPACQRSSMSASARSAAVLGLPVQPASPRAQISLHDRLLITGKHPRAAATVQQAPPSDPLQRLLVQLLPL